MNKTLRSRKLKSLLPYFLLAVAIIVAYRIINEFSFFISVVRSIWDILTPFFYGFLLAYIVNIPSSGIQRLLIKTNIKFIAKRKKIISIIIVFALFTLILILILNLVIPSINQSIALFITNLPAYYDSVTRAIDYINSYELPGVHISPETIMAMLQNFRIDSLALPFNALINFTTALFRIFLAFISSIYILLEKEKFKAFLCRALEAFSSPLACRLTIEYANKLNGNFKRYIYTQTIDGCILGSIVTIELYLIGSPYALILGIMLGVVNYVPYFGSIFGSIVAVIIVGLTQGFTMAAIAALVLLITQQIDGNVIQPRLLGSSFSLNPFLVIVSITIGGAIAGILGMIAAIPIVQVLNEMFKGILEYYERKKLEPAEKGGKAEL